MRGLRLDSGSCWAGWPTCGAGLPAGLPAGWVGRGRVGLGVLCWVAAGGTRDDPDDDTRKTILRRAKTALRDTHITQLIPTGSYTYKSIYHDIQNLTHMYRFLTST